MSSLRDLHVEPHVAKNEAETAEALAAIILSKAGCKSVVVAGIPARNTPRRSSAALAGLKADYVEDLQSGRPEARRSGCSPPLTPG